MLKTCRFATPPKGSPTRYTLSIQSWRRLPTIPSLLAALLLASMGSGCGVELTQGNSEPFVVAVGPLTRTNAETLDIDFSVADFQHDDAEVKIAICTMTKCYIAVADGLSPSTSRVSTVGATPNAYSASHQFIWKRECGLLDPNSGSYSNLNLDDEFWVSVSVPTNNHAPIESEHTTLKALGYTKQYSAACP